MCVMTARRQDGARTDPDPRHAVKVGNGDRLEVSKIGEMQTKVNTMTPVTRKGRQGDGALCGRDDASHQRPSGA